MLWLRVADGLKCGRRRRPRRNTRPFMELNGFVGVKPKIKKRRRSYPGRAGTMAISILSLTAVPASANCRLTVTRTASSRSAFSQFPPRARSHARSARTSVTDSGNATSSDEPPTLSTSVEKERILAIWKGLGCQYYQRVWVPFCCINARRLAAILATPSGRETVKIIGELRRPGIVATNGGQSFRLLPQRAPHAMRQHQLLDLCLLCDPSND